jgi:radical SAM superfamily enzyme YgiQ (UPF0313 family)
MAGKKLLLTSICRPMGPRYGDSESVGYELLHGQITRSQGIFSPRSVIHYFSLDYIAYNLDTPTVVLQYPSEKEFIKELSKGYDYVGISFILSTFHKMKRMSALVRKYSPHSKIVLGGYGTVLSDEELSPYGDYFCRGEGVEFMRDLLGEPPKPMPYDHPLITNGLKVFSFSIGNNGMVFGGLGCPNGCDFCCTSHFFKRRHIRLLPEGDDVFNLIQRYRREDPEIKFTVLDEDFLLNQKRARRFLELVRASGEEPPSMFVFASIKALSQYDIRELLEMGITGVWIGYEGKRSGYAKQQGRDVKELFQELRAYGINILASFIIGFEYQTREIIHQELEELLTLKPTFTQILIYGPTPGTPFYERVKQAGLLRPEYENNQEFYYHKCTGYYGMVKHPTMSGEEIERLQERCYRRDFELLGPSVVRCMENWWNGYWKLVHDESPVLRKRAEVYRKDILNGLPMFLTARILGPSRVARRSATELYRTIKSRFNYPRFLNSVLSIGALVLGCWTWLCMRMNWFQHPRLTRNTYRVSG